MLVIAIRSVLSATTIYNTFMIVAAKVLDIKEDQLQMK